MKKSYVLLALLASTLLTQSYLMPRWIAYVTTAMVYGAITLYVFVSDEPVLAGRRHVLYPIVVIYVVFVVHLFRAGMAGDAILSTAGRTATFLLFTTLNLFLIPRYVQWSTFVTVYSRFSAFVVLVGIPTAVVGSYTVAGVTVQSWPWPLLYDVPVLRSFNQVRSVFTDPNSFGLLAALGFCLSLAELQERPTATGVGLALITGFGTVISESRASLFAAVVALVLYGIWTVRGVRLVKVVAVVGGIGWLGFLGIGTGILPDVGIVGGLDLSGRGHLWVGVKQAVSTRPLMGFGPGDRAAFLRPFVPSRWEGLTPHNSFLRMFLTTGVVGGVAYLYFTAMGVLTPLRGTPTHRETSMSIAAIVAVALQTFLDFSIFGLSFNTVAVALVFGYATQAISDSEQPSHT